MGRAPILRRNKSPAIPKRRRAPETSIDTRAVREKLNLIGEDSQNPQGDVLGLMIDVRREAMAHARELFDAGRLNGLETARLIAAIHDEILRLIYDFAVIHISRASNPTTAEIMAVCAVGGYGRGEMAPSSDLDLLFLVNDKKGSPHTERITEFMLYTLWDMGLKVGHATRTIDQNIKSAKSDQTILTALLDLRFISGEEDLATRLFVKLRKSAFSGKSREFIAAKLEERDQRHTREGNSRYVIEPNIKEGKGGLRDLHVLYWIARALDKDGRINDPQRARNYVELGLFDSKGATRFTRAADFLWRTRIYLHFLTGRANETLSFEHQTVLARKMGYASGPIEEAVEKFMREYFTNAREVGALTRMACAKLEAENSLRLPKGLDALLPNSKRNLSEDGFMLDHGRLMFDDPLAIKTKPSMIMELFEIAGRRNLDIHPDALAAIDYRRNLIDNNFRRDPENAALFLETLLQSKAPYATLKIMNEAGVLGRYILEFGHIVARTQFNMHHAYTVDEHTLHLINHLHNIETDEGDENKLIVGIARGLSKRRRRILYLACLLHDIGKGQGDQCIEGARLARRACRRIGIEESEIESISWLVRRHLDMSETAQRRDISDPETIAEFAELVGSVSRLNMLYLLTIVDIRAVGPGIWNDWKGRLLQDLYLTTLGYLEGREDLEPAAKAKAKREQLEERLPGEMATRISPLFDSLPDNYWQGFPMLDMVRHARFFDKCLETDLEHHVQTRVDKPRDVTELWVLTRDREGLFADLSYVISSIGAQIIGARLHTGAGGQVMNVFYLQNADGLAFGRVSAHPLEAIRRRAMDVLQNKVKDLPPMKPSVSRRAAAIPVSPSVKFVKTQAGNVQIIEVEGRDRHGLLHDLAVCLRDANLHVLSAHIEVMGATAVDVFYVAHDSGKTLPAKKMKALRAALHRVMDPEQQSSAA